MSLFRYGSAGISLKALLENPELQTAPTINSGNNDLKKNGLGVSATPNYGSAFLGPNLWERPNDDNNDLDFEYMDLDEFLTENGIPVDLENGIPVDLDVEGEQPPVSLLASALASSPRHQSPNPGGSELQLNIDPPSPPVQNSHSPSSPQLKMSPKPNNTGLYFPDSPVSQEADSPLGLCLSPARSPKTVEHCFLKGLLEDSPEKEVISDSGKRKRSTIEFDIKPDEVALVTIPVLTSPRAQTIITSPCQSTKQAADDHDNESDNEFSLVAIPGQENFNPKERKFTEEELKPQPMIKKSKKVFVPDDNKDEKYWNRRKKNNVAAKRSRDARRVKENQIAMRAAFLESQNEAYLQELAALRKENEQLKKRLAKYEGSQGSC